MESPLRKSFSVWKRWGLVLDLVLRTAVVLAIVGMVNYLGARWYHRFFLGAHARQELSPRTLGLLKSITNDVRVTVYYDREDPLFTLITALLREYREANGHIFITSVDYIRDMGAAAKLKADPRYQLQLTGLTNKNLVLFECEGTVKAVHGQEIGQVHLGQDPTADQRTFREYTVFQGEIQFTSALLAVLNHKPFNAYYLVGHGEHDLEDGGPAGYETFRFVLKQDSIEVKPLLLLGTNAVPADCNLLIIAGPKRQLPDAEIERVDDYLRQGGRLLALLNPEALSPPTGLERLLAGWGVGVTNASIIEPKLTTGRSDIKVYNFAAHPVVAPLVGSALHLIRPRPVGPMEIGKPLPFADAPQVEVLARTSPEAYLESDATHRRGVFPLAVAVEKRNAPGVVTERGSTRIIAVGDSLFLTKLLIESASGGNKDFLRYAANWLLERKQLLEGLSPKPVGQYRLTMSLSEQRSAKWLLLAAIPCTVLAFGGLVWLRRRK